MQGTDFRGQGHAHSRVDVIGIRDIGGDLCGDIETIAIEVKRGGQFATACGQAAGYKVYANRVYLAVVKSEDFTVNELDIASHLGVGLIRINGRQCQEVISSPSYPTIKRMSLQLIEHLALAKCQLCDTFFETGYIKPEMKRRWANVKREDLRKAVAEGKGMIFWNRELSDRKIRLGLRYSSDGRTYERRYFCPDCVTFVLSELIVEE